MPYPDHFAMSSLLFLTMLVNFHVSLAECLELTRLFLLQMAKPGPEELLCPCRDYHRFVCS